MYRNEEINAEIYNRLKDGLSPLGVKRLANYLAHSFNIDRKDDKGIYLTRSDMEVGRYSGEPPCKLFLTYDGKSFLLELHTEKLIREFTW